LVGDSYHNALAEAVNGLFKTELILHQGPWRTSIEQVELTTLEMVWWWNNQRLHAELGYRTPSESENACHAALEPPGAGSRQPRRNIGTKPRAIHRQFDRSCHSTQSVLVGEISGGETLESHTVRDAFRNAADEPLVQGLLLVVSVHPWLCGELGGDLDTASQYLLMR
jgi:Integrase core domain